MEEWHENYIDRQNEIILSVLEHWTTGSKQRKKITKRYSARMSQGGSKDYLSASWTDGHGHTLVKGRRSIQ
jgi:hypothetical protein